VAVVQYTFTHKQYTKRHKTNNTYNNTKMVKKWQIRIHVGYITKMGDSEIKGNESEVALDLQSARIRALNYVERR
jgi:hypothetical protein